MQYFGLNRWPEQSVTVHQKTSKSFDKWMKKRKPPANERKSRKMMLSIDKSFGFQARWHLTWNADVGCHHCHRAAACLSPLSLLLLFDAFELLFDCLILGAFCDGARWRDVTRNGSSILFYLSSSVLSEWVCGYSFSHRVTMVAMAMTRTR